MDDSAAPIVQWVRVSWTKASRGAPGAAARNAVPLGFVLPVVRAPMVHEVRVAEEHDFQPYDEHRLEPPPATREGMGWRDSHVVLRRTDRGLRVMLELNPYGQPRRSRRPPAVHLRPGEWVRWQVNYRFSGYSEEWSYQLDTLNLASGRVADDTFLGRPTHGVDEREPLA